MFILCIPVQTCTSYVPTSSEVEHSLLYTCSLSLTCVCYTYMHAAQNFFIILCLTKLSYKLFKHPGKVKQFLGNSSDMLEKLIAELYVNSAIFLLLFFFFALVGGST